jgi:hypothetical protein
MFSAFDQLAATSKEALDAFKSVLGAKSRQDLLASYKSALEIQKAVGGEGNDPAIDEEITDLRKQMVEARASDINPLPARHHPPAVVFIKRLDIPPLMAKKHSQASQASDYHSRWHAGS